MRCNQAQRQAEPVRKANQQQVGGVKATGSGAVTASAGSRYRQVTEP